MVKFYPLIFLSCSHTKCVPSGIYIVSSPASAWGTHTCPKLTTWRSGFFPPPDMSPCQVRTGSGTCINTSQNPSSTGRFSRPSQNHFTARLAPVTPPGSPMGDTGLELQVTHPPGTHWLHRVVPTLSATPAFHKTKEICFLYRNFI